MKSDGIVVRKEVGSGIHKICSKEVNPTTLAFWVDSVEAKLAALDARNQEQDRVIKQHQEILVKCVDTLEKMTKTISSQRTSMEELTAGLDTVRSVLQGLIDTQAEMQITKADRSELNGK